MRIGVVADTHSEPNERGLEHLAALKPDVVLHAGDIGDLAVLERLSRIAPVHAVRGNIDDAATGPPEVLVLEPAPGLRLLLTHIAVYGAVRIRGDVAKRAREAKAPLIVCGHSHVPFITQDRGLTLFNPGSLGPRRVGLPILFGVLELGARGLTMRHVDAETGEPWLPPG